jgi:hypothetical protein
VSSRSMTEYWQVNDRVGDQGILTIELAVENEGMVIVVLMYRQRSQ